MWDVVRAVSEGTCHRGRRTAQARNAALLSELTAQVEAEDRALRGLPPA